MFKLYFSPSACCTSVHIILEELELPFELIYVGKSADTEVKQIFAKVNPLQTVPVLELMDGRVITQSIAILLYLAENYPKSNLLGVAEGSVKTEIIKWLSFVASDVHKAFSPLFSLDKISTSKSTQEDIRVWLFKNIHKYFMFLDEHLSDKLYLVAEKFSIADAYLFVVYNWTKYVSFSVKQYPNLNNYIELISERSSVKNVLQRELHYCLRS